MSGCNNSSGSFFQTHRKADETRSFNRSNTGRRTELSSTARSNQRRESQLSGTQWHYGYLPAKTSLKVNQGGKLSADVTFQLYPLMLLCVRVCVCLCADNIKEYGQLVVLWGLEFEGFSK